MELEKKGMNRKNEKKVKKENAIYYDFIFLL